MLAEVKYAFMSLDLQTQSCASFTPSSLAELTAAICDALHIHVCGMQSCCLKC